MNAWNESGAMVYVAITVATLSAVIMCCAWVLRRNPITWSRYNSVEHDEEQVELCDTKVNENDEEDITHFVMSDEEQAEDEEQPMQAV